MTIDHSWSDNYKTTEFLNVRLDLVRQCVVSGDAFGLEYLDREDMDGKTVLNVGCGTGIHDQEFLTRTGARPKRYVLTDKSPAMVDEAVERVRPCLASVERHAISVDELSAQKVGRFDLIVCMHVLYHAPNPAQSIRSLARLLADGGRLLVTTVSHDNNRELLTLHNTTLRERFGLEGSPPTCWRFDTANAMDVMGGAFHEVACHYKAADLRLPTVVDAMAYYRSLVYFKDALECGVSGELLAKQIEDDVADVVARRGYFSCNKNSVTLIASKPRASHLSSSG